MELTYNNIYTALLLGLLVVAFKYFIDGEDDEGLYRDWETDRKSTRLNSSHSGESRMPSSA